VDATIGQHIRRRVALGVAVVPLLALSACGGTHGGAPRPHTALSPTIPPGPRLLTSCFLHHDVTLQGSTIDGPTVGIDIQNATTDQPDFGVGAPCLPSMLSSFVGDTVTPIPAIPSTDVLGCHTRLDDVYVIAGPGHADSLAAATGWCQTVGTDPQGHPRWWGGVVSEIPVDDGSAPTPAETQGPLPNPRSVVCRILITAKAGQFDSTEEELIEGTSKSVCQSIAKLTGPDSISYATSLKSVPSSFGRICDRWDAYVFAPSPEDEQNLGICNLLAS
jgi:hypothetical protein